MVAKMKILFLTPKIPYPPHTGGQLRSLYLLKDLAARGRVTLVTIGGESEVNPYLGEFKKYCERIFVADPKRFQSVQHIKSIWARFLQIVRLKPWLLEDFVDSEIERQILLSQPEEYDVIVIRFAVMAYHFFRNDELRKLLPRVIVDIDDISTVVEERTLNKMNFGYRKARTFLDLQLLRFYYRKLQQVPACLAVASKDRDYLIRNGMGQNVFVVPNVFEVNGRRLKDSEEVKEPEILFCGMLSYPPNQNAVIYFCEHIFPKIKEKIPGARFVIVGKHAPEKISRLGSLPDVSFEGYAPSMEPYYEKVSLVVVPLLNGAGTRIKILEAMSYERPVVSTTIGAEGLEVTNGENILIADEPDEFAKKCVALLTNPQRRKEIAAKGYRLVKEKYDLSVFHKKMDGVFEFLVKGELCQPSV